MRRVEGGMIVLTILEKRGSYCILFIFLEASDRQQVWVTQENDTRPTQIYLLCLKGITSRLTSVNMIIPKMAKKAMTMRNDMLVRSRDPHVPFLLRFFEPPEVLLFFEDSFEYIFRQCLSQSLGLSVDHPHRHFPDSIDFPLDGENFLCLK